MAKRQKGRSFRLDWFGDDLADAVGDAAEPGLWAAGQIILREARRRAPVRTGTMRDSGYVATTARSGYRKAARDRRKQPKVREGSALIAFSTYYSQFAEGGTKQHTIPKARRTASKVLTIPGIGLRRRATVSGVRRRPFLGPALDSVRERAGQELADEVRREVEKRMPRGPG